MNTTPLPKKQFVGWFILFTMGTVLLLPFGIRSLGMLILTFSNLLLMSKDARSRPVPTREMIWIFLGLAVFFGFMVASKHWLPKDFGASLESVMYHPPFVISFWGFMVWLVYRRYKMTAKSEVKAV